MARSPLLLLCHFLITVCAKVRAIQLSHLFVARVRQEYDDSPGDHVDRISVEQVRSAMNVWLDAADLPYSARCNRYEEELKKQQYYQRRSKQARTSHTKTRIGQLIAIGIQVDKIKSCIPNLEAT